MAEWMAYLLALLLCLAALYFYSTWNHNYFAKRNLPFLSPVPFFGCMAPIFAKEGSLATLTRTVYDALPGEPVIGAFSFRQPVLVFRNLELIKRVFVKDFDHFTDRVDFSFNSKVFSKNLAVLKGKEWHRMRSTLSPAFTGRKMRLMFQLMDDIAQQLTEFLSAETEREVILTADMKELFSRFTGDVIGSTAFGVQVNSLEDPQNEFHCMGKKLFRFGPVRTAKFLCIMTFPTIFKWLGVELFGGEAVEYMQELVQRTVVFRERNGVSRPDMIDLLMKARAGQLADDAGNPTPYRLEDDDIAAQAIVFFFGGFDTVSSVLSFTCYSLALHPEVQKKLQNEIDKCLEEHGKFTYDILKNCEYLDMVVSESMRLYPPAMILDRICTKPYQLPDIDGCRPYEVQPGQVIWVPIFAIHRDPKYFRDPEQFVPERFSPENKKHIDPFAYLPFGVGPRFCIAQRFALMEVKLALVHLLAKFELISVEKTPREPILVTSGFNVNLKGGLWVGIRPRDRLSGLKST